MLQKKSSLNWSNSSDSHVKCIAMQSLSEWSSTRGRVEENLCAAMSTLIQAQRNENICSITSHSLLLSLYTYRRAHLPSLFTNNEKKNTLERNEIMHKSVIKIMRVSIHSKCNKKDHWLREMSVVCGGKKCFEEESMYLREDR